MSCTLESHRAELEELLSPVFAYLGSEVLRADSPEACDRVLSEDQNALCPYLRSPIRRWMATLHVARIWQQPRSAPPSLCRWVSRLPPATGKYPWLKARSVR